MTNYRSLNHSKWACQYHVVFIPKYRKKAIYGSLRRQLGGWRWCADSARWVSSGRHVDHCDRRRVMISM